MLAAAILMETALADVSVNLESAKRLTAQAAKAGADLIVLPEFFNSCMAFDEGMLSVARWGTAAAAAITALAQEWNVIVGGSYLTYSGEDVLNTFMLAFPNGEAFCHSKDIPTQFENCYYTNGDQDNILHTPIGDIGVALCWEMLRYDTVKRLAGKTDFIVAGSCWWDLPDDAPASHEPLRSYNRSLALNAPVEFAKRLHVPVVHAAHCSKITASRFPGGDKLQTRQMVGAAQIIDADGGVAARRSFDEGEGFVLYDFIPQKSTHAYSDTQDYWIPDLPQAYITAWEKNNPLGREYYQTVSRPYYRTEINTKENAT